MLTSVRRSTRDKTTAAEGWWVLEGVAVGFIKWWLRPGDLRLSDIEVRPGWRGRGIAPAMIRAVEARERLPMRSSGSYTPLGFAALAGHLPLVPGTRARTDTAPMTFVADWDARRPLFPVRGG